MNFKHKYLHADSFCSGKKFEGALSSSFFFFFFLILDVYVRSDNHCAIGKGSAHHFALAAAGLWPVLLANLVADMFTALNFSPFIQGMRLHIRRNTAYAMTNSILPLP